MTLSNVFFSAHADGDQYPLLRHLAATLERLHGFRTVFQHETSPALSGAVCDAVDRSAVVVVCLTAAYVGVINGHDALDLCSVAFSHAVQTKGVAYLVPLVLDRVCRPPWTGTLGRVLGPGGNVLVDATLPDDDSGGWLGGFRKRQSVTGGLDAARLVDVAGIELYVQVMGKLTRRRGMLFASNLAQATVGGAAVHTSVFSSVAAAAATSTSSNSASAPHEMAALEAAADAVAAADAARALPDEDKTATTFVKDTLCGEVDAAGRAHGLSVCTFEGGDMYAGEWATGRPAGLGVHVCAAWGHSYAGQWRNGLRAGRGVWSLPPPPRPLAAPSSPAPPDAPSPSPSPWRLYVGELEDDTFHGPGTLTYANGEIYRGGFSRGRRHGRGTWWQGSGNMYNGEFVDDACHGAGEVRGADGQLIYAGRFAGGQKAAAVYCAVA